MSSKDDLQPLALFNQWCAEHDKENAPAMSVPRMLVDPAITSLTLEIVRLHYMLDNTIKALTEHMDSAEVYKLVQNLEESYNVTEVINEE